MEVMQQIQFWVKLLGMVSMSIFGWGVWISLQVMSIKRISERTEHMHTNADDHGFGTKKTNGTLAEIRLGQKDHHEEQKRMTLLLGEIRTENREQTKELRSVISKNTEAIDGLTTFLTIEAAKREGRKEAKASRSDSST